MKIAIKAIENYLPPNIEDGSSLKKDNPDWCIEDIEEKTGIIYRHLAGAGQSATDMAEIAAQKIFASGVKKEEVEFLILITQSPEYPLPSSACILQDRLGLNKTCMAFDVNLGCSGFIYGLAVGGSLIQSGMANKGLIICSDTYSKYIEKSDRTCRPIFSDGASAVLLTTSNYNIIWPFEMGTDGSGFRNLIVAPNEKNGLDKKMSTSRLFMDGAKLFIFTMAMVPKSVDALLEKSGKKINDIDLFIFHQASRLVMDNIIRRLRLPDERVFKNYHRIGNTVSASLPIALKDALEKKRIRDGNLIMLMGFGVGYSWGGCLVHWDSRQ